jgi:tight adherence protein C
MVIPDINVPLLLACLAFLVICLMSAGILIYIGRVRDRREMIEKVQAGGDEWMPFETDTPTLEKSERPRGLFINLLHALGLKAMPGKSTHASETRLKFLRAGLRGENIIPLFWGTKILLSTLLASGFLIFAIVFLNTMNFSLMLLSAVILALIGLISPDVWLSIKTRERKKKIERGLPDALDLLVVCVEAGMGMDAAIHRVGEELMLTHPDLAEELRIVNLELRAGKSRQGALRNLQERTEIDDITSLVTLLIQTERFGTNVAQALRVYSDSFRTARYQRAEEIAAKMATKLIFPLGLFIFPCLFVVILAPAVIQIFKFMLTR